jgi:hypothetical protein
MLVLLLTLFVAMAGAACPPQIVRTYPDDGGRLTHAERVGADLDLTRGPGEIWPRSASSSTEPT